MLVISPGHTLQEDWWRTAQRVRDSVGRAVHQEPSPHPWPAGLGPGCRGYDREKLLDSSKQHSATGNPTATTGKQGRASTQLRRAPHLSPKQVLGSAVGIPLSPTSGPGFSTQLNFPTPASDSCTPWRQLRCQLRCQLSCQGPQAQETRWSS